MSPQHLQHEILRPRIIETYQNLVSKKSRTDGSIIVLMAYARSPFQNFESFLRILVGMGEEDIQSKFKQNNSKIIIYELPSGTYSNKSISEVVYTMSDHEVTLQIEYDDISMKTKPLLKHFGGTFGTLSYDENPFSTPY